MTTDILKASGVPFRRSRYPSPPAGTYAIYMDDLDTDGADRAGECPIMVSHDVTVELYEAAPDDAAEASLEAAMTAAGLKWTKQDRYWLQSEQRYQVVYEFSYVEKRRI